MSDIVERLRDFSIEHQGLDNVDTAVAFAESADEVERLRNELLERDLQIRKTLPKVPYRFVPLGERDV